MDSVAVRVDVAVEYDGSPALDGVDLVVEAGTTWRVLHRQRPRSNRR